MLSNGVRADGEKRRDDIWNPWTITKRSWKLPLKKLELAML